MRDKFLIAFASVVAMFVPVMTASADPLYYMWMTGRVAGTNDPFTHSVSVSAGQTVEYKVWGQMAPIGVSNTQDGVTRTVTSLVQGADGANSLFADLYQNASDPIQVSLSPVNLNPDPTPWHANDSWGAGLGARGVTSARVGAGGEYNDLLGIRPVHQPGVFTGVEAEVIFDGSFSVPQAASGTSSSVLMRWPAASVGTGQSAGGLKINNGAEAVFTTAARQSGADPIVTFGLPPGSLGSLSELLAASSTPGHGGLELVSVPEPGTLALVGVAALAALRRRRTR